MVSTVRRTHGAVYSSLDSCIDHICRAVNLAAVSIVGSAHDPDRFPAILSDQLSKSVGRSLEVLWWLIVKEAIRHNAS